jgi:peptidyl-prolyl cis-trans isomerase B (cyclophilin B)
MRRRTAAACVVTLLAVGAASCGGGDKSRTATVPQCDTVTPPATPAQEFEAAPDPDRLGKKSYLLTIETTCGTITAKLLGKEAPATVASLDFLAGKHYFDGTFCHRATQTPSLTVLQCGDPTGAGAGGPGYTLPEENLPKPGPDGFAAYPRGTLAMARTRQPHSGGSQFFLVTKDSRLPPDYTIFGVVTQGIEVLDAVLARGIDDADGNTAVGLDGAPRHRVFLKTVRVTAK